ncbi:MAG: F0F1 ATP synthase subunit A [Candidatus Eisenbacteria bacterium]|uniref:ATP synthase subunit a n=1 Tax=Eiseniibacteriota bacterium TaxID=2212470 RepID=A0A948W6F9_UNCEI|nr:F0F1 ATP synthase subunit A [Candidatus Eisenbacteria bacterium]
MLKKVPMRIGSKLPPSLGSLALLLTAIFPGSAWASSEEGEISTHLPTIITILEKIFGSTGWIGFLHKWENVLFALVVVVFMVVMSHLAIRKRALIPGPLQNLVEMMVEKFADFIEGILGKEGRHFVPFLGTLFFYILFMNLLGLIPLMKSSTSVFNTTIALAISVFVYVQYTGIRRLGIVKFLHHLAGEPEDVIGWSMVPLMLPLHIIGEFAKPMSLGLRLFGNIMGEDILLAVFLGLGVMTLKFLPIPVGVPFHLPFIFLAILTSAVQALVFTLLSTIYISQVLPHDHEDEHEHEHEAP